MPASSYKSLMLPFFPSANYGQETLQRVLVGPAKKTLTGRHPGFLIRWLSHLTWFLPDRKSGSSSGWASPGWPGFSPSRVSGILFFRSRPMCPWGPWRGWRAAPPQSLRHSNPSRSTFKSFQMLRSNFFAWYFFISPHEEMYFHIIGRHA